MCDSNCDCQERNDWSDSEDEEDYARHKRKSKKKKKQSCTVSRKPDPPDEPDYKPKFSLKRRSQESYQNYSMANPHVVPCIATLGSYDHNFPPLQISADDTRVTRRPYVTPPQGVSPHDPLSLYPPPYPAYTPNLYPPHSSPPQSSDYGSIFQSFHSLAKYAQPKTPIPPPVQPTGFKPKEPKPKPRPPWKPEFREFFPGDPSGTDKGEKQEKSSDRTVNFMAQNDSTSEEDSSTDYSE
ncbi:hypothetical protein PIB30_030320 [Stylosanthes scabra]|uniref:Uncharacterized protein n=1 Tax=Stylosanthes scabra TaxID=79078 RepID=A0ABU6SBS9_9FABA|nr:hypothetical protein [Stylosanthes scabra]